MKDERIKEIMLAAGFTLNGLHSQEKHPDLQYKTALLQGPDGPTSCADALTSVQNAWFPNVPKLELIGQRVFMRHHRYRIGTIVEVEKGCNALLGVAFDGDDYVTSMVPKDMALLDRPTESYHPILEAMGVQE